MVSNRIYIVEDSFIVTLHLEKTLEGEGYKVVGIADSGEQALDEIPVVKPDLVLMDIMLAGKIDGVQTAITLRENYNIPVIFITALTNKETIQRAKVAEPYGYLTKPFEDREIFTVIEMALYKSGIETRLRQSEAKFYSTLKSISDGVLTVDNELCISYANPSAESMLGLAFPVLQGRSLLEIFRLRNINTNEFPVNPLHCGTQNQGSIWTDDYLLCPPNGKEIPVIEGTISPLLDQQEHVSGLVLTFKNGTDKLEHKRLLEEIDRQKLEAVFEGQENERTRIAQDLHDGIGQMLNAIKINIQEVVTNTQQNQELCMLIDETINETKRISENLLPYKLRDFDLITCINSLCEQLQRTTKVNISFEAFIDSDPLIVSEKIKLNVFRIAQEALSNAIRHAHANHIIVQMFEDQGNLRLLVEDDGIGMPPTVRDGSRGLTNMEDRARILRGTCTFESDQNRGSIIMIEIPYEKFTNA